jgi:hypothetical protein
MEVKMSKQSFGILLCCLVSFIGWLTGCAGFVATPISDSATDAKVSGIRYYEPAPFILVHTDGKGGLVSRLIYLPDTTQKLAIDPYAYLAKNNTTLTFTNGMLSQTRSVIDETIVPKGIIEGLKTAAVAAAKAKGFDLPQGESVTKIPAPALFRVIVNADGSIHLLGGYGLDPSEKDRQDIWVVVSEPAKPQ